MKKIVAKIWTNFGEAHGKLDDVKREVEGLLEQFNAKLAELTEKANEARELALLPLDDIASDAESYFDGRSEEWQEGDDGQLYNEWKDELSNARDTLAESVALEVEITGLNAIEDMLAALDGGFRQSLED